MEGSAVRTAMLIVMLVTVIVQNANATYFPFTFGRRFGG